MGHKDKEKAGKEKNDQSAAAAAVHQRQRQSMDQQRRPPPPGGRESFSMGRASISGPQRPSYINQGQQPGSPGRAGSRVVSQPNPSSNDSQRNQMRMGQVVDRDNKGEMERPPPFMQEQGRERAGSFTSPPPSGLLLSTNQAKAGSFHSSSPGKGSFSLSRPGSVGSGTQQQSSTNTRALNTQAPASDMVDNDRMMHEENDTPYDGGRREFERFQSPSQSQGQPGPGSHQPQGGSFAVSGRPPTTSGEQYNNNVPEAPLQIGQSARPVGNALSQQSHQSGTTPTLSGSGNAKAPIGSPRNGNSALANVLKSYIDLNASQAGKLYASSPPELEMIFARQTNGAQPKYVFFLLPSFPLCFA
ncbi:hypothetical protein QFC22_003435 [Naganishia vaughanmartiniae]|uniref:Uncharacterized protein n=1 Tax=Naganishia vaughanmartiniae TaxID=1424756 RepID=A0ACC2X6N7_9TREE|nr:hypothetical protein QFC22_003435 [Naganishia vaughanmartiniae]